MEMNWDSGICFHSTTNNSRLKGDQDHAKVPRQCWRITQPWQIGIPMLGPHVNERNDPERE